MTEKKRIREKKSFGNRPFKGLALTIDSAPENEKPPSAPSPTPPSTPPIPPSEAMDDDALLESAMSDVTPMSKGSPLVEREARPKPMLAETNEDELVMRRLDELVHGDADFDFADTSEYIEAIQKGVDKRILRRLRRGEFSFQDHLDLHGLNRKEAREKVGAFIRRSVTRNLKCVLIVHGRGLGSKDNIPVLKTKLAAWLTRGSIGKKVLAYTSAMPYDGGTGAVYVLLRTESR